MIYFSCSFVAMKEFDVLTDVQWNIAQHPGSEHSCLEASLIDFSVDLPEIPIGWSTIIYVGT